MFQEGEGVLVVAEDMLAEPSGEVFIQFHADPCVAGGELLAEGTYFFDESSMFLLVFVQVGVTGIAQEDLLADEVVLGIVDEGEEDLRQADGAGLFVDDADDAVEEGDELTMGLVDRHDPHVPGFRPLYFFQFLFHNVRDDHTKVRDRRGDTMINVRRGRRGRLKLDARCSKLEGGKGRKVKKSKGAKSMNV